MGTKQGKILVVDDDQDTAELLRDALAKRGWDVEAARSGMEALARFTRQPADVVVTDVQMPGMSGIDLCQEIRATGMETLPIVITGVGNLDVAIGAMRAGAFDFIQKPVKVDVLAIAIARALDHLALRRELKKLHSQALDAFMTDGIVGNSPAIRTTIEMVHRVANSDATVLITGESGTGKELVARAVHNLSPHRDKPFIAVNCAAMPAPLLESELFGHVRGAFTDAKTSRAGLFVQASTGTIFLDEIGEMPLEMQVKLLRVLQERKVRPVGSDEEIPIHARVVTATNRDLEQEVEERRFREDLFYRINVVAIPVPPLRERPSDILVLAQHFIRRAALRSKKDVRGISEHAARYLLGYDWPGNVRELENSMERAVALCKLDQITIDDLPSKLLEDHKSKMVISAEPSELISLAEMERRYVRQVLNAVDGNKTRAAQILGIDRRSVYRRLEGLNQQPAPPGGAPPPPTPSDDGAPPAVS
ncbi:MAG TPA: sigma-54 dependent transcriptional regulator [Kofleriaceae bacterium]|nr:sigma-54 dependent transcriptional regulator [Kofleriaceae bacterium]